MADWAALLQPPDYMARRGQNSGRVAEKMSMMKPDPVMMSPGAAAVEGAIGGAVTGLSAYANFKGAGRLGGPMPTQADANAAVNNQAQQDANIYNNPATATGNKYGNHTAMNTGSGGVNQYNQQTGDAQNTGGFASFFNFWK